VAKESERITIKGVKGSLKMDEIRVNLVIYFLNGHTKSFSEAYLMARKFLGEA